MFTDIQFEDVFAEGFSLMDPESPTITTIQPYCNLFMIYLDSASGTGEILLRPYNPNSTTEKFLCVDPDSGGIDIYEPQYFAPTRFVVDIPTHRVRATTCEVTDLEQKR